MPFTSYADLHRKMLDALADGDPLAESWELPGPAGPRRQKYRSLEDFMQALAWVEVRAREEAAYPAAGRTYAKPVLGR